MSQAASSPMLPFRVEPAKALRRFLIDGGGALPVAQTGQRIARSAVATIGDGLIAVAVQRAEGGEIEVMAHSAGETASPPKRIKPRDPTRSLAEALSDLPTAMGRLRSSGAADLSIIALPSALSAGAVVLHDRGHDAWPADDEWTEPLTCAWGAALDAALALEDRDAAQRAVADAAMRQRSMEAEIADARRLRGVETLAGQANARLERAVTEITSRARLLDEQVERTRDKRSVADIQHGAGQIKETLRLVSLFAAPPNPETGPIDVARMLRSAVALARDRFEPDPRRYPQPRIRTEAIDEAGEVRVSADREHVTEALSEVLLNALQSARSEHVRVTLPPPSRPGFIAMLVTDDGEGMHDEVLAHAFDPFYTSDRTRRRLGLGLTRAKRLVELNAGAMRLSRAPEGGLAVVILLPEAGRLQ